MMDRREFIEKTIAAAALPMVPSLLPVHESDGDRNESLFMEAQQLIQKLAKEPLNPVVVRKAIDEVNLIGEWGHCGVFSCVFSDDTRQLALNVIAEDGANYHEYIPYITEEDVQESISTDLNMSLNYHPAIQFPDSGMDRLLFLDAVHRIKGFAVDHTRVGVLAGTIELVPPQYRWAQAAFGYCLFGADDNLRVVAVICIHKENHNFNDFLPAFPKLLDDRNVYVRRSTTSLLQTFGAEARFAIPRLEKCLCDDDPWVRIWAAKAIAVIEPKMNWRVGTCLNNVIYRLGENSHCGQAAQKILGEIYGETLQ